MFVTIIVAISYFSNVAMREIEHQWGGRQDTLFNGFSCF